MRGWQLVPSRFDPHILVKILACWTFFFVIFILNFPAISWTTPFGRIPGFLFWGIRFAMNALRVSPTRLIDVFKFLVQSVLMKLAKYFWRSKEEDTNDVDTKILCQFSATNPDGPHPPVVFNVSLNARVSSIASQTTGWTCFMGHCSRTS